jgi:hypothetical protein
MKICQQQLCCKPASYTTCCALIEMVLLMSLFIFQHFYLSVIICLGLNFQQLIFLCELWAEFLFVLMSNFCKRLLFLVAMQMRIPSLTACFLEFKVSASFFLYILSLFFCLMCSCVLCTKTPGSLLLTFWW